MSLQTPVYFCVPLLQVHMKVYQSQSVGESHPVPAKELPDLPCIFSNISHEKLGRPGRSGDVISELQLHISTYSSKQFNACGMQWPCSSGWRYTNHISNLIWLHHQINQAFLIFCMKCWKTREVLGTRLGRTTRCLPLRSMDGRFTCNTWAWHGTQNKR